MLYSQNLQIQTPNNFKQGRAFSAPVLDPPLLHVDVNKSHVNIIILDVDIIILDVDIK